MSSTREPRVSEEVKQLMQLTKKIKTTDWYLYQNYTEIGVYGSELAPYKLPKYLSMRIFSLEYIRQMIGVDEVHFLSAKKKSHFRIKSQIDPLICNSRATGGEADKILKEIKFTHSFNWSYDPIGIISKKRVEKNSTPYTHTHRLEIEKYMNQEDWVEDTL